MASFLVLANSQVAQTGVGADSQSSQRQDIVRHTIASKSGNETIQDGQEETYPLLAITQFVIGRIESKLEATER